MQKDDCFLLGHISRKHGYKGEVVAFFDTDQPQKYRELESVFVDYHGELVPFFIEELATNSKGHFILRFEDVDDEAEAENMIGRELYLPLQALPPLSGKAFYYHEVIGFEVIDKNSGSIGTCKSILESTAQPVFLIEDNGNEIMVPAVDDFIESIDREKQQIHLNCPEGLLDIYRNAK